MLAHFHLRLFLILTGLFLIFTGLAQAQENMSLFTDLKARNVGDVLSVIVVESANAARESKSNRSSSSSFDMDAGASGNVAATLPSFGANSGLSTSYDGNDGTQQNDRLSGRITVRITEQLSQGLFKIKGERKINVNGEENLMQLEGFVRERDILTSNTVYSYQVADAKITYRKSGITNRFLKQGFFSRTTTLLVGGLMLAAGLGYFTFAR